MIREIKLAIEDQPRMLIREPLEVECRKFYVWSVSIEAHGHMGSCPGYALLIWQGKATKPRKDEFRERIGRIIERTLAGEARMERSVAGEARMKRSVAGEARMKTYKDRIAETERVKERKRARVEVQWMCLRNPRIKTLSRWLFDMRTHLAVTSENTSTKRTE